MTDKIELERLSPSNEAKNVNNNNMLTIRQKMLRYLTSRSRLTALLFRMMLYVLLIGLAFVFIYPFMFMIITSLKSNTDLSNFAVQWIPTELKFENYYIAWDLLKFGRYFKNSFIVMAFASVGHILSCSFIGYGFARYNFPFKKLLFTLVILAFIVPVQTIQNRRQQFRYQD